MAWTDNLQPASFRGVPFKTSDDEGTFGRRVQTHEYPNRDKPYTEDRGRATRRITISAYVIGEDFALQRDKLIEVIERAGPGTLVHPFYGEMKVNIDGGLRVSHSQTEGRMCRIEFAFVEAGELSFPTSGAATGKKLISSCSVLDDCISSAFKSFGMDGLPDFLQNGVIEDATAMLDTVTDIYDMVDSGVSAAARLLQGDLSVLLGPPSSGMDFVNQLQKMWRSGSRLLGNSGDLISMIKGLTGVTLDSGLAPRGVWKTNSATVQKQQQQSNFVAQAIRTTAISEAAYAVTNLPTPRQPVNQQTSSDQTDQVVVQHPAVGESIPTSGNASGLVTSSAGEDMADGNALPSWDDLTATRDVINTAIDQEMLRVTDDQLFLALVTVRADVNGDISARLQQTDKTTSRTPAQVLPALVLAADWYDSAARDSEIIRLNAIKHPGFVPLKALKVAVR